MLELNTLQLERILKKDKYTKNIFLGVFSRDYIPKNVKYPCCFIINTDPSTKPGEHWLAFYYDKKGFCYFFDSYGLHPKFYNLHTYLTKTSRGWTYNTKRLQSLNSKACGFYCFIYLLLKSRNIEITKFNITDNNLKLIFNL